MQNLFSHPEQVRVIADGLFFEGNRSHHTTTIGFAAVWLGTVCTRTLIFILSVSDFHQSIIFMYSESQNEASEELDASLIYCNKNTVKICQDFLMWVITCYNRWWSAEKYLTTIIFFRNYN